jgi:eukaryotic-like serine/threonine-protein kinase
MTVVLGEVIAERYELEEIVGTGGMSSVYRAHDRLLERSVALKILHDRYSEDEEYVERFRREARAAARLSHPNIVTVIDRGEQDGRQFIVFEHVAGETLKDVVEREGPLPARRVIELGIEIANALAFAHGNGLVHRDVKPQNVLLNGDGRAKVTDFGIARSQDVEQGMTQTGTVVGTSHYIAPEQARGDPVDEQSDVYSLGAVLYELLTGEVPYPGDNFVAVAMRHLHDPVPDVQERRPDVPSRLAAVVERALQKEPADRFPSMKAFSRALEGCLADLEGPGAQDPTLIVRRPPPVPKVRPPRPRRRRALLTLGILVLGIGAIVAIVVGALLLRGSSSSGGSLPGPGSPVALHAVATYDPPPGDGTEQDDLVPNATDGDSATYWETEHYSTPDFGNLKDGVGIVVDAGKPVKLGSLTVTSGTPGFNARIKASDSEAGPFRRVSDSQAVGDRATFSIQEDAPARYYLFWVTSLPPDGYADINEITAP